MNSEEPQLELFKDICQTLSAMQNVRLVGVPNLRENENSSRVWIQKIVDIPDEVLRFRRFLYGQKNGTLKSFEYCVLDHLIRLELVSKNTDACTNIPWRYFDRSPSEKPFDNRVKKILEITGRQGFSGTLIRRRYRKLGSGGFPDLLEFNRTWLAAWELKSVSDVFTANQREKAEFLQSIGVKHNLLKLEEVSRSANSFRAQRNAQLKLSKVFWTDFWKTRSASSIHRQIIERALSNEPDRKWLSVSSRRKGSEDLLLAKQGPNYFVRALTRYMEEFLQLRGADPRPYSSSVYRGKLAISSEDVVEIAEALFRSGSIRWWKVLIILIPFITDNEPNGHLQSLIKLGVAWESVLRTDHLSLPYPEFYRSGIAFRPVRTKLRFSAEFLLDLYRTRLKLNSTGLKDFVPESLFTKLESIEYLFTSRAIVLRDNGVW